MTPEERINTWKLHPSQRGQFAFELYKAMAENERIWLLTGDLGFAVLDPHRDDFPDRFVNVGASEQLLLGAGVGLALDGKIPFCYSITTFLIYRAFEWIRNYVNHENIPVRLVGSGYGDDYKHDGITHQPHEIRGVMEHTFYNIDTWYPETKEQVSFAVSQMIAKDRPHFICLRR